MLGAPPVCYETDLQEWGQPGIQGTPPGLWSGRVGQGASMMSWAIRKSFIEKVALDLSSRGSEVSSAQMQSRNNPGGKRERCEQRCDLLHFVYSPMPLPELALPDKLRVSQIKLSWYLQRPPSECLGSCSQSLFWSTSWAASLALVT